jgi:hypothetical protein
MRAGEDPLPAKQLVKLASADTAANTRDFSAPQPPTSFGPPMGEPQPASEPTPVAPVEQPPDPPEGEPQTGRDAP